MSGSRKDVTADQPPTDRIVTVQVEGLPGLLSCSDEVHGLVRTPAELRSWADAVTDLAVTASFMRRRIASRPDSRIGEVIMAAVMVAGRLPGCSGSTACRVRLQVHRDRQPLLDAVMGLLDVTAPELRRQAVDPDAVWAALGVADVAAGGRAVTIVLYLLAAVVAVATGVSSFDALEHLASVCGIARPALLAVAVDAGEAAGAVAWLRARRPSARSFGRAMTLVLIAASIAGNAAVHLVGATPPTWVAVVVSAVAPTVLGGVVHLVLLVVGAPKRPGRRRATSQGTVTDLRPAADLGVAA